MAVASQTYLSPLWWQFCRAHYEWKSSATSVSRTSPCKSVFDEADHRQSNLRWALLWDPRDRTWEDIHSGEGRLCGPRCTAENWLHRQDFTSTGVKEIWITEIFINEQTAGELLANVRSWPGNSQSWSHGLVANEPPCYIWLSTDMFCCWTSDLSQICLSMPAEDIHARIWQHCCVREIRQ